MAARTEPFGNNGSRVVTISRMTQSRKFPLEGPMPFEKLLIDAAQDLVAFYEGGIWPAVNFEQADDIDNNNNLDVQNTLDDDIKILFSSEDNTPVTAKEKAKLFLQAHWSGILCIFTPIILIALLIPFPPEVHF